MTPPAIRPLAPNDYDQWRRLSQDYADFYQVALTTDGVRTTAEAKSWGAVRCITRENNYRARVLCDKLAEKTDWLLYEMTVK